MRAGLHSEVFLLISNNFQKVFDFVIATNGEGEDLFPPPLVIKLYPAHRSFYKTHLTVSVAEISHLR